MILLIVTAPLRRMIYAVVPMTYYQPLSNRIPNRKTTRQARPAVRTWVLAYWVGGAHGVERVVLGVIRWVREVLHHPRGRRRRSRRCIMIIIIMGEEEGEGRIRPRLPRHHRPRKHPYLPHNLPDRPSRLYQLIPPQREGGKCHYHRIIEIL